MYLCRTSFLVLQHGDPQSALEVSASLQTSTHLSQAVNGNADMLACSADSTKAQPYLQTQAAVLAATGNMFNVTQL